MDLTKPLDFFLAILPAMVANATPVASKRLFQSEKWHPIDGRKVFIDGRRILGDGKTYEGFALGVLAGTLVGLIEALATADSSYACAGLLASIGALLGDMVGSFIKRRLGMKRGAPAPILDQLDFYAGAVLVYWLAGYSISLKLALAFAVLVAVLHVTTNYAAYKLGLKSVPW